MGWQWLATTLSYFQQSNSSWRLFTVCFVSFSQNKLRLKHEFREVVRESVTITVRNKVQEIILDELWKGNQIDLINNRYTCLTSALDYQQHNIDTSCFFFVFVFKISRLSSTCLYRDTLSTSQLSLSSLRMRFDPSDSSCIFVVISPTCQRQSCRLTVALLTEKDLSEPNSEEMFVSRIVF